MIVLLFNYKIKQANFGGAKRVLIATMEYVALLVIKLINKYKIWLFYKLKDL